MNTALVLWLGLVVVAVNAQREYSGLVETNRTLGHFLNFWAFESATPSAVPVVLWLNGGPGASSIEYGSLFEMGPFAASADGQRLVPRNASQTWASAATLLFVDQPVGVGYSYSKSGTLDELRFNTVRAARELAVFLSHFFGVVAPHLQAQPFFIFGESYGGHYVPQLAYQLLQTPMPAVPHVQGIGLGNAWVWPSVQVQAWSAFAKLHKLIGGLAATAVDDLTDACLAAVRSGDHVGSAVSCNGVVGVILLNNPGMEIYDIRKHCPGTFDHDCYNMTAGHQWVRSAAAKQRLGVPASSSWQNLEIELVVMAALNGDDMDQFAKLLPPILASGTRVMAYNGMYDLLCNWIGTEQYLSIVGGAAFNSSAEQPWPQYGWARQTADRSLTFVKIDNSGHLAPHNQPEATLDMLQRFLHNGTFL
jgi:carboxypeptidase C (cathepsin A)